MLQDPVNFIDPKGLEGYSEGDWFPCIEGYESNKDILNQEDAWCVALEKDRTPPKCQPNDSRIKIIKTKNRVKAVFTF